MDWGSAFEDLGLIGFIVGVIGLSRVLKGITAFIGFIGLVFRGYRKSYCPTVGPRRRVVLIFFPPPAEPTNPNF